MSDRSLKFKARDHWIRLFSRSAKIFPAQKFVLVRMAHFLRVDSGVIDAKIECIADACGASERHVRNAIEAASEAGWLKVERGARYAPNRYRLLTPPQASDAALQEAPGAAEQEESGAAASEAPGAAKNLNEERKISEASKTRARASAQVVAFRRPEARPEPPPPEAPASFSEWDFLSSDGSIFFAKAEIDELEQDAPNLKNIRGEIRQAARWAMEVEVRGRRKEAVRNRLMSANRKAGERIAALAAKAPPEPLHPKTGKPWKPLSELTEAEADALSNEEMTRRYGPRGGDWG